MDDNGKVEAALTNQLLGGGRIQLLIDAVFDPTTGNLAVNVTGPIDNKFLAYALLESARDLIQAHTKPRIVSQDGPLHIPPQLRGPR